MNFLNNEFDDSLIDEFAQALNVSRLISFLLINRGTKNVEEAKNFLHPHFNNLYDPFLLKDMDLATGRIEEAINRGENILVYGDEDVDGISSTVILLETLRNLGGKVDYIIPNKAHDGIGLREKFIRQAQLDQVTLIITVDCGITNFVQVELAKSLGMDVIITDHHEPQKELPAAYAIVNPMRNDCSYPFDRLSGAGVALKVSQAVSMRMMKITKSQWFSVQKDTICFAMLGTISDRVPLTSENRIFARYGLERIRQSTRPWVRVLIENFYSSFKPVNMSTILSLFVPLLSSGESKNGKNISCDLLLSDDVEKITEWADELHAASQDWFFRARSAFARIKTNLTPPENNNLLLIVERDTEVDVLSYCASKIKDLLKCPVVMIGFKEEYVIGEARAPKGCDLVKYFRVCEDLFIDYGGHKCAAGFSVLPENLQAAI
ncbi:DHH family phosphoesterase, partial [bacterium]|nr:DHH family phosphoesterase [bacterium]